MRAHTHAQLHVWKCLKSSNEDLSKYEIHVFIKEMGLEPNQRNLKLQCLVSLPNKNIASPSLPKNVNLALLVSEQKRVSKQLGIITGSTQALIASFAELQRSLFSSAASKKGNKKKRQQTWSSLAFCCF